MIVDYSKQLSTTYETLSYLHWIRQMAPTEAEKTTRMRAKANKDPRRSWIWLMSDQKWSTPDTAGLESSSKVHKIHTTLFKTFFGRTFVERGTIFIQWYSEHIIIITILSYTTRIRILNNTHPMFFRTILREPSLWEAVQLCGMAPPPLQVFLEFPQGLEIR